MTDSERLDFLDRLRRAPGTSCNPAGWGLYMDKGSVVLSNDHFRPRSIREAIDAYHSQLFQMAEYFGAQAQQEDVRALALEEQERAAVQAEADSFPG